MNSEDNSYTLKREAFGQQIAFKAKEAPFTNATFLKADPGLMANYEPKNPKGTSFTNFVEKSSHMVNTEKIPTKTITLSHLEGGWPDEVINHSEQEKVQREMKGWVRAQEKTERFEIKIRELIANTEKIMHQNQLMDVYEEYFDDKKKEVVSDNFEAKTKLVFKDPSIYKRSVVKVVWNVPDEKEEQRKIAVAYKLDKNQDIPPNYNPSALVWDIDKPNTPINVISHSSEIVALAFNNKHAHILGCGFANGQAGIYDLNENKWIGFTKVETSHTEPVSDFVWMKSKNSNEFATSSTDGSIIWWEIEKDVLVSTKGFQLPVDILSQLEEKNEEKEDNKKGKKNDEKKKLFLKNAEDNDKEYGATRIDNSTDAGASKFLLGTEQGVLFIVNKKKSEGEIGQKLGLQKGRHLGPIVGMQRNPTYFKFILTVGDWTARIWTEDLRSPIYISKYFPAYLNDCLWTPRIGMFLICRSDGYINGYDLCYKLNDTTFSYKVADLSLTTMSLNVKGDKLLVGDEDGVVYLIKLSKSFYDCSNKAEVDNKKNMLNKLFEREQTKEKMLTTTKKMIQKNEGTNLEKLEKIKKEKIKEINELYMEYTKEFRDESGNVNNEEEQQQQPPQQEEAQAQAQEQEKVPEQAQ